MNLKLPPGGVLIGIGADVIEVSRIRGVFERQGERFLARVFTDEEREYCFRMAHPHKHLAARFAAKEAVSKCFTTGIGAELGWRSVSVYHGSRNEPLKQLRRFRCPTGSETVFMPSKASKPSASRRWSQHVTQTSNALDLDSGVFTWASPKRIARSLKHSAESSHRRKGSPLQSAMSMLNFYMNRAGHTLPVKQKRILEKAKDELHNLFEKSKTAKS